MSRTGCVGCVCVCVLSHWVHAAIVAGVRWLRLRLRLRFESRP